MELPPEYCAICRGQFTRTESVLRVPGDVSFWIHPNCFECPCGKEKREIISKFHQKEGYYYLQHGRHYQYGACKYQYKFVDCDICGENMGFDGVYDRNGSTTHRSCLSTRQCHECINNPIHSIEYLADLHNKWYFSNQREKTLDSCCQKHQHSLSFHSQTCCRFEKKLFKSFIDLRWVGMKNKCYIFHRISHMEKSACKRTGVDVLYTLILMKKRRKCPFSSIPVEIIVLISRFVFDNPFLQLKKR